LVNIALYAHESWWGAGQMDLSVLPEGVADWGSLLTHWQKQMGAADPDADIAEFLRVAEIDPSWGLPDQPGDIAWANGSALGIAALNPNFLFR
jgi:hypothetical protein